MSHYEVCLEISGPYAMWTRPDTGDCPVSYPAPTYSAVKGIFESILWGPAVQVIPTKVEICTPLQFHNYQTNYGGPLRKGEAIKGDNPYQLLATVLVDVCYRMYACALPVGKKRGADLPPGARAWDSATTSPGHAYQAIFNRRLQRGQSFCIPCLGWKEFVPDYVGPFRQKSVVVRQINQTLPSMLREVFPHGYASGVDFTFSQNVAIENGVLVYPPDGGAYA